MVDDDDWDSILLSQDMDKAISDAEETFKLKPNDSRFSGSPQQQSILRNIEEKKQRAIAIRAERQAIKNLSSKSIEEQRRACFRNGLRRSNEWDAIVDTDLAAGEMMVIQACAGAGKSTCLGDYMGKRVDQGHVFLVLSHGKSLAVGTHTRLKSWGLDKQTPSGGKVTVKTAHSMAWAQTVCGVLRGKNVTADVFPNHIAAALGQEKGSVEFEFAADIKKVLERFTSSADSDISIAIHAQDVTENKAHCVVAARRLWEAMIDPTIREIPITHSAYMKYLQLHPILANKAVDQAFGVNSGGKTYCNGRPYTIVLDEAQDCCDAIADIICNQRKRGVRLIVAMDAHQIIFQFMFVDCRRLLSEEATYKRELSTTFRFGPPLTQLATTAVTVFKGGDFQMQAANMEHRTTFREVEGIEEVLVSRASVWSNTGPAKAPVAIIARRNATLFMDLLRVIFFTRQLSAVGAGISSSANATTSSSIPRINVVGGLETAFGCGFGEYLDLELLRLGRQDQCTNNLYKRFIDRRGRGSGWLEFKLWAAKKKRTDELSKIACVEAAAPLGVEAVKRATEAMHTDDTTLADLFFTTVHKGKGLEWGTCYIAGDLYGQGESPNNDSSCGFFGLFESSSTMQWDADVSRFSHPQDKAHLFQEPFEEANIAYVALTRAKNELLIHSNSWEWLQPCIADAQRCARSLTFGNSDGDEDESSYSDENPENGDQEESGVEDGEYEGEGEYGGEECCDQSEEASGGDDESEGSEEDNSVAGSQDHEVEFAGFESLEARLEQRRLEAEARGELIEIDDEDGSIQVLNVEDEDEDDEDVEVVIPRGNNSAVSEADDTAPLQTPVGAATSSSMRPEHWLPSWEKCWQRFSSGESLAQISSHYSLTHVTTASLPAVAAATKKRKEISVTTVGQLDLSSFVSGVSCERLAQHFSDCERRLCSGVGPGGVVRKLMMALLRGRPLDLERLAVECVSPETAAAARITAAAAISSASTMGLCSVNKYFASKALAMAEAPELPTLLEWAAMESASADAAPSQPGASMHAKVRCYEFGQRKELLRRTLSTLVSSTKGAAYGSKTTSISSAATEILVLLDAPSSQKTRAQRDAEARWYGKITWWECLKALNFRISINEGSSVVGSPDTPQRCADNSNQSGDGEVVVAQHTTLGSFTSLLEIRQARSRSKRPRVEEGKAVV